MTEDNKLFVKRVVLNVELEENPKWQPINVKNSEIDDQVSEYEQKRKKRKVDDKGKEKIKKKVLNWMYLINPNPKCITKYNIYYLHKLIITKL